MDILDGAIISYALIAISVAVSLFVWKNPSYMSYGFHRGFYEAGDYTRFSRQVILHQFIHGDILHLVMNMYFLYMAGPLLESYLGSEDFLFFFFSVTIVGSVALYFFAPKSNTVGISGFCMAILAYLWITMYTTGNPGASEIGTLLLINIGLGFVPGISLVGHLSGALSGLVFWYTTHNLL